MKSRIRPWAKREILVSAALYAVIFLITTELACATNVVVRVKATPAAERPKFGLRAILPDRSSVRFDLTAGDSSLDQKVFEDLVPAAVPLLGTVKSMGIVEVPIFGWVLEDIQITGDGERPYNSWKHVGNGEVSVDVADELETITITLCHRKVSPSRRPTFTRPTDPREDPVSTIAGRFGDVEAIVDAFFGTVITDRTGSGSRAYHTPTDIPAFVPDPADDLRNVVGGARIAAVNAIDGVGAEAILGLEEVFLPPPPFPRLGGRGTLFERDRNGVFLPQTNLVDGIDFGTGFARSADVDRDGTHEAVVAYRADGTTVANQIGVLDRNPNTGATEFDSIASVFEDMEPGDGAVISFLTFDKKGDVVAQMVEVASTGRKRVEIGIRNAQSGNYVNQGSPGDLDDVGGSSNDITGVALLGTNGERILLSEFLFGSGTVLKEFDRVTGAEIDPAAAQTRNMNPLPGRQAPFYEEFPIGNDLVSVFAFMDGTNTGGEPISDASLAIALFGEGGDFTRPHPTRNLARTLNRSLDGNISAATFGPDGGVNYFGEPGSASELVYNDFGQTSGVILRDPLCDWLPLEGDWDTVRGIHVALFDGDGDGDSDAVATTLTSTADYFERTGPDSWVRREGGDNPLNGFTVGTGVAVTALNPNCNPLRTELFFGSDGGIGPVRVVVNTDGPWTERADNPANGMFGAPVAGDFDGNPGDELLILDGAGDSWTVHAQNPADGTFSTTGVSVPVSAGVRVSAQDANGDNRTDIVLSTGTVFFNATENPGDPLAFSDAEDVLAGLEHATNVLPLFLRLGKDDPIADVVTLPRTGPGFTHVPTYHEGSVPVPGRFEVDDVLYDPITGLLTVVLDESIDGADYDLVNIDLTGVVAPVVVDTATGNGGPLNLSAPVDTDNEMVCTFRVRRRE